MVIGSTFRMVCFAGAILPWGSALYGVAVCTPLPGASTGRRPTRVLERARPPDARRVRKRTVYL